MVKPKNMLRKKLCRDMSRAAMQFLSIIALCALGTFAFSALDGMARMIRTTLNTYYEENNLADFWITLPTADRASMEKLAALPDVEAVCARASVDLDTTLPGDVSVSVTVYDGEMTINKPLLREGALLEANDPRGCLVEERFAQSKGLSLGDRLTVKLRGRPYSFTIRGVVVSPEYIVVTDGMAADPDKYGFILVNACAIPELPLTQIVATMADGADSETVQAEIEAALPDALVVDRTAHRSTARANNDAQMFENMTLIFPVLAYAVAALIVMTTLSRMIDNQRMQMGTLQALGFSAHQIKMHYLSYAIAPSAVGAVLGTLGMVDYYGAGVLTVFIFYFFHGHGRKWWCLLGQLAALYWVNVELLGGLMYPIQLFGMDFELCQQGLALLALVPIWLYRGRQGYHSKPFQYACYAFYPVHMLLLVLVLNFVNR